jgi:molecular chaperone IbpA
MYMTLTPRPNTLFDINKFTPYAVGFDRVFDQMTTYLQNQAKSSGYPPYNISQLEANTYLIEVALAGVPKEDISLVEENGTLTISYTPDSKEQSQEELGWLYKGIASRAFTQKFSLADNVKVKSARMINGMLSIQLQRIIPDAKKPKQILISE